MICMTECELNISTTLPDTTWISYKTNTKEQSSRVQSFFIKQEITNKTVHEVKINKNLCIFSDYGGVQSLFCLWIAVRYRLSWAWRTCAPIYCLSYFFFKIYMKNVIRVLISILKLPQGSNTKKNNFTKMAEWRCISLRVRKIGWAAFPKKNELCM